MQVRALVPTSYCATSSIETGTGSACDEKSCLLTVGWLITDIGRRTLQHAAK